MCVAHKHAAYFLSHVRREVHSIPFLTLLVLNNNNFYRFSGEFLVPFDFRLDEWSYKAGKGNNKNDLNAQGSNHMHDAVFVVVAFFVQFSKRFALRFPIINVFWSFSSFLWNRRTGFCYHFRHSSRKFDHRCTSDENMISAWFRSYQLLFHSSDFNFTSNSSKIARPNDQGEG